MAPLSFGFAVDREVQRGHVRVLVFLEVLVHLLLSLLLVVTDGQAQSVRAVDHRQQHRQQYGRKALFVDGALSIRDRRQNEGELAPRAHTEPYDEELLWMQWLREEALDHFADPSDAINEAP